MCGICGFWHFESDNGAEILSQMTRRLAHRGPDGHGEYCSKGVGLGHTRLAIIDLDGGIQPMTSVDQRYVTVFNGEIYNYRELRAELRSEGAKFATQSDTEVIAEAIRHWGIEKGILRLRGMFAFAVYDHVDELLYLGRDRTGIKPLYYAEHGGSLFFASEQKSLLEVRTISRNANPEALSDFLTLGFPVTPNTCWRAIKMFPPAHYATIRHGDSLTLTRYWRWVISPGSSQGLTQALSQAKAVLQDSLLYHLRSDVPVAAFLSGGIDSSLLVRLLSDGLVENLKTFNVGFDEAKYDESADARHVAELCGTDHHQLMLECGQGDPNLFETILSQYDEPFGDSSCLPTYLVSQEVRKHAKVVISGEGGDELFGGYPRVNDIEQLYRLRYLPMKGVMKKFVVMAHPLLGTEFARRFGLAMDIASGPTDAMYCTLYSFWREQDKVCDLSDLMRAQLGHSEPTWHRYNHYLAPAAEHPSARLMATELAINLHADYLRKVDIASSSHGLEVRLPFLDSSVLDFTATLSHELILRKGTLKYLLRELARQEISSRIADKVKWGFGLPFDAWCGSEMISYLEDLLFSTSANSGVWQILKRSSGEKLWKQFYSPVASNYLYFSRYQVYQRIFMLASLQIWIKRYKPIF